MRLTGSADPVSYIQSLREHSLCWFTCQCGVHSFSSHKVFPALQYVYAGKLHALQTIRLGQCHQSISQRTPCWQSIIQLQPIVNLYLHNTVYYCGFHNVWICDHVEVNIVGVVERYHWICKLYNFDFILQVCVWILIELNQRKYYKTCVPKKRSITFFFFFPL
jgi:hypothetical protein